eukprot:3234510-Prymnesium_polylepis.1
MYHVGSSSPKLTYTPPSPRGATSDEDSGTARTSLGNKARRAQTAVVVWASPPTTRKGRTT